MLGRVVLGAAVLDVVFEEGLGVSDFVAEVLAAIPLVFGAAGGFTELAAEVFGEAQGFGGHAGTSEGRGASIGNSI